MTLAEFLLVRIAEDEAAVRGGYSLTTGDNRYGKLDLDEYGDVLVADPEHVLAECEAKRTTIAVCTSAGPYIGEHYRMDPDATDVILRALALPYADHPEFREEWRSC